MCDAWYLVLAWLFVAVLVQFSHAGGVSHTWPHQTSLSSELPFLAAHISVSSPPQDRRSCQQQKKQKKMRCASEASRAIVEGVLDVQYIQQYM